MPAKECEWTGLIVKKNSDIALKTAIKIIEQAKKVNEKIKLPAEEGLNKNSFDAGIDYFSLEKDRPCRIIVIGGDGTLLRLLQYPNVEDAVIATIGAGRRCYFFDIDNTEINGFLKRFIQGDYIEHRIWRLYIETKDGYMGKALNEVVIAGDNTRIIRLSVDMGHRRIFDISGDGVIVATTQGSTAYSLSAGGPIVDPLLTSMIITPLNPTQLHIRPIVVEPFSTVRITVPEQDTKPRLIIDGIYKKTIESDYKINIRLYEKPIRIARFRWVRFYERVFNEKRE